MAQRKAHEVDSWLAKPPASTRIILIYGPDRGLVSERARTYASSTGLSTDDPFAVLKLDAADLSGDAGRLIDEARTISMFGDGRLIWLRGIGNDKSLTEAISALCDDPPTDCRILLEAGDLKKGTALRRTIENADPAMALPCYADTTRSIDTIIDEELARAGMSIGLEARQLLKDGLGGDRLASRGEIEKLILYCGGQTNIEPADVLASTGDVSALSQDAIVDSVLSGNTAAYDMAFTRFVSSGAHPFVALSAMLRQLQALQVLRHRLDAGNSTPKALVSAARPPVFFSRRALVERALTTWDAPMIARALDRLQQTILRSRQLADLSPAISRQALLSLCLESARRIRRH